jgi:hypothetical protein
MTCRPRSIGKSAHVGRTRPSVRPIGGQLQREAATDSYSGMSEKGINYWAKTVLKKLLQKIVDYHHVYTQSRYLDQYTVNIVLKRKPQPDCNKCPE